MTDLTAEPRAALFEIRESVDSMRSRLEDGQGGRHSAMCRLSLRMSEELLSVCDQQCKRIDELETVSANVVEWLDSVSMYTANKGGQRCGTPTMLQVSAGRCPSIRREFEEYSGYLMRMLAP